MKKISCAFMIGLTLINFWGCARSSTSPNINDVRKTEVSFSYLNDDYEVVEDKTDNLWMKVKDISERLSLVSSKTNDDEYTAILTDEKNNITVAMVYKDGKNFPDYITFAKDEHIVRGTASDYVNGAFDILWELDGSQEVFYNIKLTNNIDDYNNIASLDNTENYQAKTIITSLKIWNAINNYVQDPDNKPNTRFFFIFGIILAVTVSTAAVVAAAVVAATAIIIAAVVVTVSTAQKPKKPPVEVIPEGDTLDNFPSIAQFSIQHNGIDVKDGEVFTIDYNGAKMTVVDTSEEPKNEYIKDYHSRLTLNPIHVGNGKENNEYNINVSLEGNHGDPNSLIDAYYRFFLDKKKGANLTDSEDGNLYISISLPSNESNFMILDIDKKNRYDNTNNLNLNFVFKNPIEIYGRITNNFLIQVN